MLETKTVTGTWLVEETTHLYDLTIAEGAALKAPEGKFIAMTVDGIGCDPKPGRYHGDIILTVAETYHMAPHALMRLNNISREFTDAVVIESGKVIAEKGVPALIQEGTVTGEKAEGVYISSTAESFNGILVTGDQPYLVKDCKMELDGFGANDFMGVGSAVAAIDTADVTIDGCDFTVNGVTRCAVHVGGDSHVTVKNSRIQNTSPDSDWLGDFSWACGFLGTNRLCQLCDNGTVVYDNCDLISNGWGILSIDGTDKYNDMLVKNSRLTLSGPRSHGYGAFCIGGNHVRFEGCDVNVTGYPLMLRGMMDKGRAEIVDSKIRGRRFGLLAMGDTHSVLTLAGSDFETDKSTMVFKGSATTVNITETAMRPGNGVILQLMDNDESGMTGQDFKIPVGEADKAIEGRDLTTAGEDDINMTLTACRLTGDFFNSTTNIQANKRSTQGGFGKFHDTLIGTGQGHNEPTKDGKIADGPDAPKPDEDKPKMVMKDLDTPKNLGLTLVDTTITGIISSATQHYREGLTLIDESNRREMSNITQKAAPTVNNGVIVSLDRTSRWTVTGTSYITALELAPGAVVDAPEGKTLKVTLDGKAIDLAPGRFAGKLVLTAE
ncbi:MAG: hypothetical protein UEU47_08255 [Oscillospiraceae bacterium]|nr:hypothetical protein [Oscillospiraceae bacterium]